MAIGLCTMLLVAAPYLGSNVYMTLMAACLILGIFDGCFITMLGPIAFDICGTAGAGQAIGFLLGICSIPLTVGPPVAGLIYERVTTTPSFHSSLRFRILQPKTCTFLRVAPTPLHSSGRVSHPLSALSP